MIVRISKKGSLGSTLRGDRGEVFVSKQRFHVYVCPRCGRVELSSTVSAMSFAATGSLELGTPSGISEMCVRPPVQLW
jgi:hypothetical protein